MIGEDPVEGHEVVVGANACAIVQREAEDACRIA
jgi:hypothetical protein